MSSGSNLPFLKRTFSYFSSMLSSGDHSDMVVRCGSESWRVHKFIMRGASDFFSKACDGEFVVSSEDIMCHAVPAA